MIASSEATDVLRNGWTDAVATLAPDVPELAEMLCSRLDEALAAGSLTEDELLGAVDEVAEIAARAGTAASPLLARRLRRPVYEYLLALDASAAVREQAAAAAVPAWPAPLVPEATAPVPAAIDGDAAVSAADPVAVAAESFPSSDGELEQPRAEPPMWDLHTAIAPAVDEESVTNQPEAGHEAATTDTAAGPDASTETAATANPGDRTTESAPAAGDLPVPLPSWYIDRSSVTERPAVASDDTVVIDAAGAEGAVDPAGPAAGVEGTGPAEVGHPEPAEQADRASHADEADGMPAPTAEVAVDVASPAEAAATVEIASGAEVSNDGAQLEESAPSAEASSSAEGAHLEVATATVLAPPAELASHAEAHFVAPRDGFHIVEGETTTPEPAPDDPAPGTFAVFSLESPAAAAPAEPTDRLLVLPGADNHAPVGARHALAAFDDEFDGDDAGAPSSRAAPGEGAADRPPLASRRVAEDDDPFEHDVKLAETRRKIQDRLRRKRCDEAAAMLQLMAQETGGRAVAELAMDAGDRCRALGKTNAALNCYLAASRSDPVFELPLSRLADFCIDDQDIELAVSYLDRIARLARMRNDEKAALRVYRRIATVAPYREDVLTLLMNAHNAGRLDP